MPIAIAQLKRVSVLAYNNAVPLLTHVLLMKHGDLQRRMG